MKKAIRCVSFLLIASLIFIQLDRIFVRKSLYGWWNMTTKINGFFNSENDTYDVVFFGSSHAYCSFNPLIIGEETGLSCYTVATPKQPLWSTYYYIDEAIKRQHPSLIVVDLYSFSMIDEYTDDSTNYTFTDDFPSGLNKLEMIEASAPAEKRFELLFRFAKYHSRWSELDSKDFGYDPTDLHDYLGGYCLLVGTDTTVEKHDTSNATATPSSEKNEEWLRKIIKLCDENETELLLVKTPSNETETERGYYMRAAQIAEETGTDFINFNDYYDIIGIDIATDFYDKAHFNYIGAEKFGRYFSKEYLTDIMPRGSLSEDFETRLARYKREASGNYNVIEYPCIVWDERLQGGTYSVL